MKLVLKLNYRLHDEKGQRGMVTTAEKAIFEVANATRQFFPAWLWHSERRLKTRLGNTTAACPSIVTAGRHESVVSEGLHPCKSPGDSPLIMSNDSL